MARLMAEHTRSASNNAELVEAVARVEREMIRLALGELGEGEGDDSSLVRCPKKPKPTLNRSAVAIPMDPAGAQR
jgi:hypothetical protein